MFDIDVRIDPDQMEKYKALSFRSKNAMLRPILLERFHVELGTDTKRVSVYNLFLAHSGPKLKSHSADNPIEGQKAYMLLSAGKWIMPSAPLSFLAAQLSGTVGEIVCDQTGLSGNYDISLNFSRGGFNPETQGSNADESEPDLFTALKEQLGLELAPAKELIPVIEIKNASRPVDE